MGADGASTVALREAWTLTRSFARPGLALYIYSCTKSAPASTHSPTVSAPDFVALAQKFGRENFCAYSEPIPKGIRRKVVANVYALPMSKHVFTPKRKKIPKSIQRLVSERDLRRCRHCLRGEPDVALCFDHIIPWSVAQDNSAENIQLLCVACNAEKGARLPGESAEDERRRISELNRKVQSLPEYRERHRQACEESMPRQREINASQEYKERYSRGMARVDRGPGSTWRRSMQKVWSRRRLVKEPVND